MTSSIFLEVTKLAAVGLISGVFASLIASRDHRFKKWWELRVVAYQNVIESLSDLVYCYDCKFNAVLEHRLLPEEFEKRLDAQQAEAHSRVRKAADTGAFLFSDEANAALSDFMKAMREDHQTYEDHLDSNHYTAKQCLKTVVGLSKKDLQLSWHFYI
jgi:hypothetical protein